MQHAMTLCCTVLGEGKTLITGAKLPSPLPLPLRQLTHYAKHMIIDSYMVQHQYYASWVCVHDIYYIEKILSYVRSIFGHLAVFLFIRRNNIIKPSKNFIITTTQSCMHWLMKITMT